jgi:hypothetical protein
MSELMKEAIAELRTALVEELQKENVLLRAASGANARTRRRIKRIHAYDEDKALTAIRRKFEAARSRVAALEEENFRLREALKPFAPPSNHNGYAFKIEVTREDFYRAAEVLKEAGQ